MSGFLDCDIRHCATHGVAKATSDHTLGGSDAGGGFVGHPHSHTFFLAKSRTTLVTPAAWQRNVFFQKVRCHFHPWQPALKPRRRWSNTTGDREVLKWCIERGLDARRPLIQVHGHCCHCFSTIHQWRQPKGTTGKASRLKQGAFCGDVAVRGNMIEWLLNF